MSMDEQVVIDDQDDLDHLADLFSTAAVRDEPVYVCIDDIDRAFKVKVGNGSWSPPLGRMA